MKKILLPLLIIHALAAFAYPDFEIHGIIKDADTNEPLPAVNIVRKGTVAGTITNLNGEFSINLKGELPVTLIASFVGYRSQEVVVTQPGQVPEILLAGGTFLTEEVVVTASRVEES